MRVFPSLCLLGVLALAGCIDDTPDDPPAGGFDKAATDSVPEGATLPWSLEECRYIVAFGWVDGARLVPYLPDGFTPRANPLLPAGEADTLFGFDVMTCASGTGLNGRVAPMQFGYLWAGADPPAAYLQEGVDAGEHYAMWDVLVPDADRRALLEGRGVPVWPGSAELTTTGPLIAGGLTLDGLGTFAVTATPAVERTGPFDGSFVKMSEADGGAAAWRSSATSGPRMNGVAVLEFPAGSWAADVVGDQPLHGQFHSGTWSYTDAEIRFVGAGDA